MVIVGLGFWEVSADSASESVEEDEDEDEDEELAERLAISALSFDVLIVGVGTSVTLESEEILDSSVGFLNLGSLRSHSESLSEEVESESEEVESESEELTALAVDRKVFVAPVLLGLNCFSSPFSAESEADSLPNEELLDSDEGLLEGCCLMPLGWEIEILAPGVVIGFATPFFVFFGVGSSSLPDDSELELADGGVLRFNGFVISMAVGFRDEAPRPAVSFSSSASLSELEVADEEDVDSLDLVRPFADFGEADASFMSMSESLLSVLSSSLPLLLVCAASALAATLFSLFALSSIFIRFLLFIFGAGLSSPSLLLVSSSFCFSS